MNVEKIIAVSKASISQAAEMVAKEVGFWDYQMIGGLSDQLFDGIEDRKHYDLLDKEINDRLIEKHAEGYKKIARRVEKISERLVL